MKNKQRPGFKKRKNRSERGSGREEARGKNGMRMPIKVGNWSPLLLSILCVPIFP